SLRYTLQTLWEAAGEATRSSIRSTDGAAAEWWSVNCALQEAQGAAHRTTLTHTGDGTQADLWWYLALPPRPRPHPVEEPHRPHAAAVTGRCPARRADGEARDQSFVVSTIRW
ncbi:hypothetical protein ACWIGN_29580, partial [Streptomyces albidoflavus]